MCCYLVWGLLGKMYGWYKWWSISITLRRSYFQVKDENNNTKNSATFPNSIRIVSIEDDEIMELFDVTSLYTNIHWYDISFTNKLIALPWKAQHLQPQFICRLMKVLQYLGKCQVTSTIERKKCFFILHLWHFERKYTH